MALLLVLVLITYGKLAGLPVQALVAPPPASRSLYVGFLTHAMQLLCAVPVVACAFSFALLQRLQPGRRENQFLLVSGLVTGGFWINEMYRIHVILGTIAGTPKWLVILGYSSVLAAYAWAFRDRWRSTPYGLIIATWWLFVLAFAMDSRLLGNQVSDLFEGIPKFFSFTNLALYFWLICYRSVLKAVRLGYVP